MSNRTYQSSGVDRVLGDQASQILYEAARATWQNREGALGEVCVPLDDFSGVRTIDISELPPGTCMGVNADGVGTKIEIAERVKRHDTMAYDLLAMVCDDAVIRGAEPALVSSILDVSTLSNLSSDFLERVRSIAQGYVHAAQHAGVSVVNGEFAELGSRVQGADRFAYNWGASVVWFARKDRLLTGSLIKPGHEIVALREKGFRANGISLLRAIVSDSFGNGWHTQDWKGRPLGEIALEPSTMYTRCIVEMTGGVFGDPQASLLGAAHITGGGIPSKLGRLLKTNGFGARLDALFAPPSLMLECQRWGRVLDEEAYRTWNMGQGMLLISDQPRGVLDVAARHDIEARVVGHITETPEIQITSQGALSGGQELIFPIDSIQ